MYKVNKYLKDIIKELEAHLSKIKVTSGSKTSFNKTSGKRDGIILAIDTIRKYIEEE